MLGFARPLARHGPQSHGAGVGSARLGPDGNRSPALTGRWFGGDLLNLLTREDASGFGYLISVCNEMSVYWHSALCSGFPVHVSFPRRRYESISGGCRVHAAMQHSAGLPAAVPRQGRYAVGERTSQCVITAQPANVAMGLSSQARRCQSLNQIGQPLASGWSEPSCTHLALGRIVRVYAHGVVAHVKMMNRVVSTHSGERTSQSGRCSAKNVQLGPQWTSAQPTRTGQKRDCPRWTIS